MKKITEALEVCVSVTEIDPENCTQTLSARSAFKINKKFPTVRRSGQYSGTIVDRGAALEEIKTIYHKQLLSEALLHADMVTKKVDILHRYARKIRRANGNLNAEEVIDMLGIAASLMDTSLELREMLER